MGYYQQVGRAGRALATAHGVLLSGQEEAEITEYFIESAFPSRNEVGQVLSALERTPDGLSINELMQQLNVSRGRIDKTLLLLSLESPAPIAKQKTKWMLTVAKLRRFWAERKDDALRRSEQKERQGMST